MVSMSGGVEVQTTTRGGLFAGLRRAVLGGESFFVNTFTAAAPGEVAVAPRVPGDVIHVPVGGQPVLAQSTAFLASAASVQGDSPWGGARSFFAGEGFFLLRLTGQGDAFLSSYGAIHERRSGRASGRRSTSATSSPSTARSPTRSAGSAAPRRPSPAARGWSPSSPAPAGSGCRPAAPAPSSTG